MRANLWKQDRLVCCHQTLLFTCRMMEGIVTNVPNLSPGDTWSPAVCLENQCGRLEISIRKITTQTPLGKNLKTVSYTHLTLPTKA